MLCLCGARGSTAPLDELGRSALRDTAMIPHEYRLDRVADRVAARLETQRRTYPDDPEGAERAFAETTEAILDDVITEFRADGFTDRPERHEAFLRRELLHTFLPRYTRMAVQQTALEARGYGMGTLHGPVGRVVLFFFILVLGALLMRAPMVIYVKFAMLAPLLFSIFLPDLIAWATRVRYAGALREAVSDMAELQDRALDYAPTPRLSDLDHD
ncbi:MAG: hypothetical protein EA397_05540 [Deltaproteobacteria bacterium]|nr:MAG: hypothetical protein EA397_05540 [Deltaproteobacteria bacterium]